MPDLDELQARIEQLEETVGRLGGALAYLLVHAEAPLPLIDKYLPGKPQPAATVMDSSAQVYAPPGVPQQSGKDINHLPGPLAGVNRIVVVKGQVTAAPTNTSGAYHLAILRDGVEISRTTFVVPKDNAHVQSAPIYQDERSTASFLFAVSPAKSPDSDRISLKLQAEPRRYS